MNDAWVSFVYVVGRRQLLGEGLGHVSDMMAALNIGGEQRDDIKYPCAEMSASSSDISSISSSVEFKNKRKKLRPRSGRAVSRHLAAQRRLSDASDTTIDSTFSLRTESVVLDLDKVGTNLGISIVGHRNRNGDHGIFVGTVRRDSVAFACGRIRPGSCMLEVNGQDLTKMSNESALRTVRTEAQKKGPLHLVLGKFWDVNSASRSEDFEKSVFEETWPRTQEVAKLTYVQPNYCSHQPSESQMVSTTNRMVPPTYAVAPLVNALARPSHAQATPILSSKSSGCVRRRSDHMRNEKGSCCQMTNTVDDRSSIHSRRHSLPGILEPEHNFPECLPLSPPIPPRPRFEGLSSVEDYLAYLPYQRDSRGPTLNLPQTPFRGIDLIEWITNQLSSNIGAISPRLFCQQLLDNGAIVDVCDTGNSTQFSENGYYVIASSRLPDKQIVI